MIRYLMGGLLRIDEREGEVPIRTVILPWPSCAKRAEGAAEEWMIYDSPHVFIERVSWVDTWHEEVDIGIYGLPPPVGVVGVEIHSPALLDHWWWHWGRLRLWWKGRPRFWLFFPHSKG